MIRFIRITISFMLQLALGIGVATAQSVVGDNQIIRVTGQVVDASSGKPLVGVNTCYRSDVLGYEREDISGLDGHFELNYPRKYMMTATRIGYKPQQLYFSSDTTILIRLEKDAAVADCPKIYLISGVVLLDDENDWPCIGARVEVKDTDIAVAADINGEFKIATQKKGVFLRLAMWDVLKKR